MTGKPANYSPGTLYVDPLMATALQDDHAAADCLGHGAQAQSHADQLVERILHLGGEPILETDQLQAHSREQLLGGNDLAEVIREDITAGRINVDGYAEIIRYLGNADPITGKLLKRLLFAESQRVEKLNILLRKHASLHSTRDGRVPGSLG